ncbi:MAG TPA: hypothetical protein VJ748_01970, partial [Vitreimonas sp.]|nr:hypothetical protein [Vitreimonas sp.]
MVGEVEGREAKLQAAKILRDAGFKYLAAELEHGSLYGLSKDEPFFLLCGRDRLAPTAIKSWIEAAR